MRRLAGLSIKPKVLLGFTSVLLILAALIWVSDSGLRSISSAFRSVSQRIAVVGTATSLDHDFLEMRIQVRDFGLTGRREAAAKAATVAATVRAGEAGKGFAVVASEVKGLAQQTASATEEVSSQIGQIQVATRETVLAIQGITGIIEEVSGIATAIASAVEEQGAATDEIARNVQQAAIGTQTVTTNIVGMSRATTIAGEAAAKVLAATSEQSRQTQALSAEVTRFVEGVRAA